MSGTGQMWTGETEETEYLYLAIVKAGVCDHVGELQQIQQLLGFTGEMSVSIKELELSWGK